MSSHKCIKDAGWMTTADAAAAIGMSRSFVLDLAHSGRIRFRKFGSRVQIERESFERYVSDSEGRHEG